MDTLPATTTSQQQRFPGDISSHAVWLYLRFGVSFQGLSQESPQEGAGSGVTALRVLVDAAAKEGRSTRGRAVERIRRCRFCQAPPLHVFERDSVERVAARRSRRGGVHTVRQLLPMHGENAPRAATGACGVSAASGSSRSGPARAATTGSPLPLSWAAEGAGACATRCAAARCPPGAWSGAWSFPPKRGGKGKHGWPPG